MKKKVAITGIGMVSPLGIGARINWEKLKNGITGIGRAEFTGSDAFPHSMCGMVPEFDPTEYIANLKLLKLMNNESMLGAVAAKLALEDAGIGNTYAPEQQGLYFGAGLTSGELSDLLPLVEDSLDEQGNFSYYHMGTNALPNCNPLLSFKILTNMPLCYISILFNIKGPNLIFNPWSSRTAQAIGEGMRAIQEGELECAVVGGCDSKSNYAGFLIFSKLGLLSAKGICCPFNRRRDGIILSEGATVLVLEDFAKAHERGANIYAELAGYGNTTSPTTDKYWVDDPAVLVRTIEIALADAGITANDIDYVCASASSVPEGDMVEAQALETVFKESPAIIGSVKGHVGDMLAAASPFALATACLALKEQIVPPLLNFEQSEEDIVLRFCGSSAENQKLRAVLVNAFEMGNAKVSIIVRNV
ncbi:MAG: hypothetical protein A2Y62_05950 [Candidatus Fischerbacteria bacterium RBG_13_37_8]|uniref:Ketosynthase family 3 (KS3) domain-containing protein n=1 Tax=Candidatus Fischerbacteria bacterium RBG_13_37_8 TaxID=1817863 RepID=A0A1F5V7N0_9BACT|nr:MAG: hypothetical protein A2Y62_05950 [Candidatus Fischerbacteria bacterium RBG_13_37_8]